MKNFTKFFIAIVAVAFLASAQVSVKAQAFENGSMVANAGLGFGWYSYGYGNVTSFPAISVSLEKGVKELDFGTLSLGGIVGFKRTSYSWTSNYDWSWTDVVVAARGAIHADVFKVEKLDTYGGLGVGLRFQSHNFYTVNSSFDYVKDKKTTVHPLIAFYVGGRYYFSEKFAGFGELGYGLGYFTLGISYKLK